MARPFQAATTLSSRPGCGRAARARASSRGAYARPTAPGRRGRAGSCSTDEPCSKVPPAVTSEQVGGPRAVVGAEHRRSSCCGGPDVRQALLPVGCRRRARRRTRPRAYAGRAAGSRAVSRATRRASGAPVAATSARRPGAAARCRRASSRSAARPSRRRRSSARSRRPAGRRSRRGPSPRSVRSTISRAPASPVRRVVAQQELERHRRRELRRAAEPAVRRVELATQGRGGRVERLGGRARAGAGEPWPRASALDDRRRRCASDLVAPVAPRVARPPSSSLQAAAARGK